MHAIKKDLKKGAHVEIQNDFQNMFHFILAFTIYVLKDYIDICYGGIYPEKNPIKQGKNYHRLLQIITGYYRLIAVPTGNYNLLNVTTCFYSKCQLTT